MNFIQLNFRSLKLYRLHIFNLISIGPYIKNVNARMYVILYESIYSKKKISNHSYFSTTNHKYTEEKRKQTIWILYEMPNLDTFDVLVLCQIMYSNEKVMSVNK